MTLENNKPYRQTKKLIRIALEDGWTQTAIAQKARVQQSVVSDWKNGKAKAKEHQVEFLLEQYGNKLRKLSTAIYATTNYFYQITPEFLNILVSEDIDPAKYQNIDRVPVDELNALFHDKKIPTNKLQGVSTYQEEVITQVEAPVIFKFLFQNEIVVAKQRKKVSVKRWILHSLGKSKFLLAVQSRKLLSDKQIRQEQERQQKFGIPGYALNELDDRYLKASNDEAARWDTQICEFADIENMIERIDKRLAGIKNNPEYSIHDIITLPFSLKKALLDAGYPVKGVKKISAY